MLETLSCDQLSQLGDCVLEELLQFSVNTVDTHQADGAAGLLSFYDQDGIESVQSTLQDCASENLEFFSLTAGIDIRSSSIFILNFDKNIYFSSSQLLSTLWAGDCEFSLTADVIEAQNKMIHV